MVQYQLPSGVMELSEVFGHIESSYEALLMEDYSVSQTTLDNVRSICSFLVQTYWQVCTKDYQQSIENKFEIFFGPKTLQEF